MVLERFWGWYQRHYAVNLALTSGLFTLQLVHLYWLTTHVVAMKLLGQSYFTPTPFWQYVIILVDYSEIPALISTTVLYLYELRKGFRWKYVVFIAMLNSQWLHLFWITDEFILSQLMGIPTHQTVILPYWLAWVALVIDYLELPVIADTIVRLFQSVFKGGLKKFLREESKFHVWHL